jgi:hypothetical protein
VRHIKGYIKNPQKEGEGKKNHSQCILSKFSSRTFIAHRMCVLDMEHVWKPNETFPEYI